MNTEKRTMRSRPTERKWYATAMGKASRKKRKTSDETAATHGNAEALRRPHDSRSSLRSFHGTQNFKYYLAASVSLITFVVYLSSLQNEFVNWDDNYYVSGNPHIRSLNIAFLRWAFLDFHEANWHPLTWISHALDYAVWGPNPLGHHLTSILLHAVNTFVVVLLVTRLVRTSTVPPANHEVRPSFLNDRAALITGGAAGLLFGLHPLHVESVVWVAERKDLLCALFFLLSLGMYTKYAYGTDSETAAEKATPRFLNRQYLLSLGFFILALLSKPMAVSLPLVLLVLDWHPFGRIRSFRTFQSVLAEKLPFVVLSLVSSILTILAQKAGEAMTLMESVPLSSRALVALRSLIAYLQKMILPLDLIPYYPYPKNVSLFSPEYLSASVMVVAISAACVVMARRQKLWSSVWGYYVVTLVPVLGIVQVGAQSMADRYAYLPSLGPFLLTGLGVAWIWGRLDRLQSEAFVAGILGAAVFMLVLGSLTFLTIRQAGVWKNSLALWNYVIEKKGAENAVAYNNRGMAFADKGLADKAIEDYTSAVALNPSYYQAYYNRGIVFDDKGQLDKAVEDYNKAIELNPSFSQGHYNRGIVLVQLGRFDKAIEAFGRTIALNPLDYDAYYNQGSAYFRTGMFDEAIRCFSKAIDINPSFSQAYNNRGFAYSRIGQDVRSLEDLNMAIALDRNYAGAYLNRGQLYLRTGNKARAASDFQKACGLGNESGCMVLRDLSLR